MKWLVVPAAFVLLLTVAAVTADPADGITLSGFFTDDNGHLFEADIDAIAAAGITRGCNPPANTRFCPNDNVERGAMAAFIRRALNLPDSGQDHFLDDNNSVFEGDINALASAGITKGCNPPANNRFCPNDDVTRGQMAAFLKRALNLPGSGQNFFIDDNNSVFEGDINALAAADITRGCNPPTNNRFCPNSDVTRGQMAAFLKRALNLTTPIEVIPVGHHGSMNCAKDGERCSLVVNLSGSRTYRVQEGMFQVTPASVSELNDFNAGNTRFTLTLNGSTLSVTELGQTSNAGLIERRWRRDLQFSSGNHTLVGRWQWDGEVIQTNTIVITAAG